MQERFNIALSENIITLLAHNDDAGKLVANLVDPALFQGDLRVIAERCIGYWHQHHQAPKAHTADLVADVLEDPRNRKAGTYRRILTSMIELSGHVNTNYVLEQLRNFMRLQKMKSTILTSAEKLNSKQELALSEVEDMWHEILRTREFAFDPGIRLSEVDRVLNFMESWQSEFAMGIGPLDRQGIVPHRSTVWLLLGPAGTGKSWGAIHAGKKALVQRKKVVHLSLEMGEEQVFQRYYQSIFSIPKRRAERIPVTTFKFDRDGELQSFAVVNTEPDFFFGSPSIKEELESHVQWMGGKFENLIIKRFPPRQLTPNGMRAYLDNLEATEGFIPDLLICDSPYLMKIDSKNWRIDLGRTYEEFRAIAIERNIAAVATHQISREGARATTATYYHVAEDWSVIQTSDYVVTLTATDTERSRGLARLYVSKARDERDKFGMLLTQNYDLGQFALESVLLPKEYWDLLKTKGWSGQDNDDEES